MVETTKPPMGVDEAKAQREAWGLDKEDPLTPDHVVLPESTGPAFAFWLKKRLEPLIKIASDDPELQNINTLVEELANAETISLVPLSENTALQDNHGWKFQTEGTRTPSSPLPPQSIALDEQSSRKFLRAVNNSIRNPLSLVAGFAELQAVRGATDEIKNQNTTIRDQAMTLGDELQKIAKDDYKISLEIKDGETVDIISQPRPIKKPIPTPLHT